MLHQPTASLVFTCIKFVLTHFHFSVFSLIDKIESRLVSSSYMLFLVFPDFRKTVAFVSVCTSAVEHLDSVIFSTFSRETISLSPLWHVPSHFPQEKKKEKHWFLLFFYFKAAQQISFNYGWWKQNALLNSAGKTRSKGHEKSSSIHWNRCCWFWRKKGKLSMGVCKNRCLCSVSVVSES